MVKIYRKGNAMPYLVGIILALLVFVIYLNFFVLVNKSVTSDSEDLLCRAYVSMKDLPTSDLAEFFFELNHRCKKDFIDVKETKKEKIFEEIPNYQKKCWYRYGEGKYDFMTHFGKEGNWCFECAELEFNNDEINSIYSYNDYIEYLKNKSLYLDTDEINKTYFEYMNLKYAYVNDTNEMYEIKGEIDELLKDGDKNFISLGLIFNEQYSYLSDLMKKEINTDEKIYVVYRYDKPQEDFSEKMTDAVIVGGATSVGVMLTPLLWSGATLLACGGAVASGGFLGPICGIAAGKTLASFVKTGVNLGTDGYKMFKRISRISEFMTNTIQYSRKAKKAVKMFTGSVEDLKEIRKGYKKEDKISKMFDDIIDQSEKIGINHIDKIDDKLDLAIKNEKDAIKIINEYYDKNWKILSENDLDELIKDQDFYTRQVSDLKNMQKEIIKLEDEVKRVNDVDLKLSKEQEILNKKTKIIKGTTAVVAGAAAGYMAFNANDNENQYVDLMTEEQYYRLCGTHSFNNE